MKLQYKLIALLVIVALFFGMFATIKILSNKLDRFRTNYEASLTELEQHNKETVKAYNVTVSELKEYYKKEADAIRKDFDVKLRNAIQYQNVNTITTNEIHTILKDSTINDSIKIGVLDYSDEWSDFHLLKIKDSITLKYTVRDSLEILLHKEKRNVWEWLSFKKQTVLSTVKSKNPNTKITYNRVIEIGKRKNK